MSSEKQRNLRLQGRFAPPKKRTSPQTSHIGQRQSLPTDGSPSNLKEPAPFKLTYSKTDYTASDQKPVGPVRINDDPAKCRTWIPISKTENGTSEIYFDPDFMDQERANMLLGMLNRLQLPWEDRDITIRGEKFKQPRLVYWIGPFEYQYSNVLLQQNDTWPDPVYDIRHQIEEMPWLKETGTTFNSVLLNWYRNEKDSVAWHSDNELSMGVKPLIASVSLGETRKFEMRSNLKNSEDMPTYEVNLKHGSLLFMNGAMQDDWLHRVPKEYHARKSRINLTFRNVYPV